MKENTTGGPAFSRPEAWSSEFSHGTVPAQTGMTLRDYFAAKVMAAYIQESFAFARDKKNPSGEESWSEAEIAMLSYEMADAMLEARIE